MVTKENNFMGFLLFYFTMIANLATEFEFTLSDHFESHSRIGFRCLGLVAYCLINVWPCSQNCDKHEHKVDGLVTL
jgi:hypothetical protein